MLVSAKRIVLSEDEGRLTWVVPRELPLVPLWMRGFLLSAYRDIHVAYYGTRDESRGKEKIWRHEC